MRKLRLLLPPVLLVLVFALAACGGGGGGGESDEEQIVDVIETSATSTDPADCRELATLGFLEQTQLEQGSEAVASCEEDAEDTEDDPDSVDVTKVRVNGPDATADAAFNGGSFDGQALSIALVEEDGSWKLDEITGFAKFDQGQVVDSIVEALESGDEPLEPQVVSCIGEALSAMSRSELEDLLIGGSSEPIVEVVEACQ